MPVTLLGQTGTSEPEKPLEITKLSVEGVSAISEEELLRHMSITESSCTGIALTPFCWVSKSSLFYKKAFLDREELARDILRARVLYFKHGYRNAMVDTVITPDGKDAVHVTIKVDEGPPTLVADVSIEQIKQVIPDRLLNRLTQLSPGEPFDLMLLDSIKARMLRVAWRRGYSDAVVDTSVVIDTANNLAWVKLTLDPKWQSRIGDITIYGNMEVEDSSILRSLLFKPGDIYRSTTIDESLRSLYESNLFRRASIELREENGEGDSVKSVMVLVQEGGLREARISLGFNTINFIEAGGRYTDHNWFGKARRLTVQATLGNLLSSQLNGRGIFYDVRHITVGSDRPEFFRPTYTASIESRRPWFLSPANEIALGIFANRRSSPGIFVDRGYGATATFTRRMAVRAPASLNYRFEVTNIDAGDVYFCANNGICDQETLIALRRDNRLSPFALSANIDRTVNPEQPRRGYRGQVDTEIATTYTFSDFSYGRISTDAAMFRGFGKGVLAFHLRAGYVNTISNGSDRTGQALHPRKRFYAGGSQSVRGFGESQLGPRILTVPSSVLRSDSIGCPASLPIENCDPNSDAYGVGEFDPRAMGGNTLLEGSIEYRFPLVFGFIGATFIDAAYVGQNINPQLQKSRTAITPGFGVRYLTPVGPIRVDLGINPITSERLPVITEEATDSGRVLRRLTTDRLYEPSKGSGWRQLVSRLRLHLSIGESF